MKKYYRPLKKYCTEEEIEKHKSKAKDPKLCRGGRPHDFVLILPSFISHTEKYNHDATRYYEILKEVHDFEKAKSQELEDLGIQDSLGNWRDWEWKTYGCTICNEIERQTEEDMIKKFGYKNE